MAPLVTHFSWIFAANLYPIIKVLCAKAPGHQQEQCWAIPDNTSQIFKLLNINWKKTTASSDPSYLRVSLSDGQTGGSLAADHTSQTSLVLHNAVGDAHLAAQGRQEQHNLEEIMFSQTYLLVISSQFRNGFPKLSGTLLNIKTSLSQIWGFPRQR